MIEDMQIRNLSLQTQPCTSSKFPCSPATLASHRALGPDEIRAYLLYLTNDRRLAARADPHPHARAAPRQRRLEGANNSVAQIEAIGPLGGPLPYSKRL